MNVVKHSKAQEVEICVSCTNDKLNLAVNDNGKGFDADMIETWALSGRHFGLAGMRERVKGLNGEFKITTGLGRGVQLSAWIPVTKGGITVNERRYNQSISC